MDTQRKLQSALAYARSGNFTKAENVYREILKYHPDNVYALHFLGLLYFQQKNLSLAEQYIRKALKIKPDYTEAHNNLGILLMETGRIGEAISSYQNALSVNPNFTNAYYNIGNTLKLSNRIDEAIVAYRKAIELNPAFPGAYHDLATIFHSKRDYDSAIEYYKKALQLNPHYVDTYNNLGTVLNEKNQIDEAITCFQQAILVNPNFAEAYYNLGNAQMKLLRLDDALASYRKALSCKPEYPEALMNLGNLYMAKAWLVDAETCFRKALEIKPDFCDCYSNLLLLMNYTSRYNGNTIFTEHLHFGKICTEPFVPSIIPHTNPPIPDRRLKIGYVSPDFRRHSVAYFIEPVLASHSHVKFDVFCYANVQTPDAVTRRLQEYAIKWRDIRDIPDSIAADQIRDDNIDILVDLAGHTDNNRLLLFARRPAPVQASWIGYPATTGVSTIDYRFVDGYTDPPGTTEQYYTEQLIRLPGCFLCYLPEKESPDIGTVPAVGKSFITFGSFNALAKITPDVIVVWSEILRAIPCSRLIIKAMYLYDRTVRQSLTAMFAREGIDGTKIELLPWSESTRNHLGIYNQIDIGLDTFPYNGTTTTCEALWMGVPIVTLAGLTHASRVGVSLLSNAGIPELIAKTPSEYIEIAVSLANNLRRLESLRYNLRDMMMHSPLTDAEKFTINLEKAYRQMWKRWCQRR